MGKVGDEVKILLNIDEVLTAKSCGMSRISLRHLIPQPTLKTVMPRSNESVEGRGRG